MHLESAVLNAGHKQLLHHSVRTRTLPAATRSAREQPEIPLKKKPLLLQGLRFQTSAREQLPGQFMAAYGSSPEASIRADSIAPGVHMMLMNVAPVSLAIIGRCGQLIAIRKRANRA